MIQTFIFIEVAQVHENFLPLQEPAIFAFWLNPAFYTTYAETTTMSNGPL